MAVRLARVNTALVILIVLINTCILAAPLWPVFLYQTEKHGAKAHAITRKATSDQAVPADAEQLLIPSMVLDAPIHEGATEQTLNHGLWRLPFTSTPDKGGNTVIVAHRFTYTNPRGTFYHLDKVRPGDTVTILWHGKKYTYRVQESKQVPATETSVEAPTTAPTLTLYTCTPLWNPKDRLVVTATLQEQP